MKPRSSAISSGLYALQMAVEGGMDRVWREATATDEGERHVGPGIDAVEPLPVAHVR